MSCKVTRVPQGIEAEIYDFYSKRIALGETYRDIAAEYNRVNKVNHSETSLRRHYIKHKQSLESTTSTTVSNDKVKLPSNQLEINGDGSRKLLAYKEMTEEDSKNPERVMELNGFDPDEWDLVKLKVSEWTMGAENQNYSIGLEVKPKNKSKLSLEDILEANKNYTYVHPKVEVKYKDSKGLKGHALEVGLPDLHIGSAHANVDSIKEKIDRIVEYAKDNKVDKIYLTFLGDILNVDNTNETTTKGTQLKNEGTPYQMYLKTKDLINYIVRSFAEFETEVFSVIGNHSGLSELITFDALKDSWKDNPQITFDVDDKLRKAFLYGNTLVGLTHGNMPKANLFGWLASDFSDLWGKSTSRELHYGHFHSEDVTYVGGVTNRRLPTTKGTDDFEDAMGYLGDRNMLQTFIYNKETGLTQINYW